MFFDIIPIGDNMKYTKYFGAIILALLSTHGITQICNLENNKFFISFLFIPIFLFFYIFIKKNYLKIFKNKRTNIFGLIISILISYTLVLGYNLTIYDVSYIQKIKTHFIMIELLPIIFSVTNYFLYYQNKIVKTITNWNIPTLNQFLFKKSCFIKCFLCIIIAWIPIFLAFYPGIFSYDSSVQLNEFLNNQLSNNNPIIHTLIVGWFIKLGNILFHSYSIGVVLYTTFQMIITALVFSYIVSYLNKRGASFSLKLISLLLFMFLPTHSILAITTTKDVFFSLCVTLLFIKLVDMIRDPEKFFHSIFNIIIVILLSLSTFIFRHNGYYAFLVLAIFMLIGLRKYWKQVLVIILITIGSYKFYLIQVNRILNITPDKFPGALLCVPLQQIGRVYNNANDLTSNEIDLLKNLETEEEAFKNYKSHKSDDLSWRINPNVIYNNLEDYAKLYVKLGLRHPIEYVDAFLANTMGYWYIGDTLPDKETYRTYIEVRSVDDFHNTNDQIKFKSKIKPIFNLYYDLTEKATFQYIPFLSLIMSVGFQVILLIVLTIIILFNKEYSKLIPTSLILGILATVLLGPVAILRYVYYIFTIMPIMIYLVFSKNKDTN